MRTRLTALLGATLLVSVGLSSFAFSDEKPPADAPPAGAPPAGMPSEKEMEDTMRELGKVGEQHKWLAQSEGAWNVATTMYGSDGKTTQGTGTSTFRMILGGRWQEQTFQGTYKGEPFEGRGLTGYDNLKKAFVNTWYDSMSTGFSTATCTDTADKKNLVFTGSWDMPQGPMAFRMTLSEVSKDQMTFKMSGTFGGKEFPMMDMVYTRVDDAAECPAPR